MKLFVKVFLISYLVSNAFRYFIEYSRKNWTVSVSISNIKFRFRSSWSSWCTPCVHHIDPNALKSLVGWNMLRTINVKRTNKNNNWNSNRSFFRAAATVQIRCYNRTCFETCFSSIRLMKFHSECHLTSVQLLFLIQLTTKSMFQINVLPSLLVIIFVVRSNAFLSDIVKEVNFTKLKDNSNEFEFE